MLARGPADDDADGRVCVVVSTAITVVPIRYTGTVDWQTLAASSRLSSRRGGGAATAGRRPAGLVLGELCTRLFGVVASSGAGSAAG